MRPLSTTQASRCEHATTHRRRCRCRCCGALHGASRVTQSELPLLHPDDPHHVANAGATPGEQIRIVADAWQRFAERHLSARGAAR